MAVTYYVVVPFDRDETGRPCRNQIHGVSERHVFLSDEHVIPFSLGSNSYLEEPQGGPRRSALVIVSRARPKADFRRLRRKPGNE